jgi:hypothetical protein
MTKPKIQRWYARPVFVRDIFTDQGFSSAVSAARSAFLDDGRDLEELRAELQADSFRGAPIDVNVKPVPF